jgi:hypothetical protein
VSAETPEPPADEPPPKDPRDMRIRVSGRWPMSRIDNKPDDRLGAKPPPR